MARLPRGWVHVSLANIADVQLGKMLSAKSRTGRRSRPYVRNVNVRWSSFDLSDVLKMDFSEREVKKYRLLQGDVLVCEGGEPGRAAVWRERASEMLYQKALHRVRFVDGVMDSQLFVYQLEYHARSGRLVARFTGSTIKHLPQERFLEVELDLPPLAEQRRIVAAIEQHLSRLDAAVAALERVRAALARYRAAVLKAACVGRLVETEVQVVQRNGNSYERGDLLLRRILQERGVTESTSSHEDSPETPEGWATATLDDLADVGTGSTPLRSNSAYYTEGTIPWVMSGALNDEYVTSASEFVTEAAVRDHRLRTFPAHTLLVAMYGATRGKCSELLIDATVNQAIAAIQLTGVPAECRPFIKLCLLSQQVAMRQAGRGGAQPNLNLSVIRNLRIPVPPLAEQRRIVAEVDRRLSLADAAERAVSAGLAKAKRLRQAILKRAFEGRLVPQDPNDEPANVLLERVRAARANAAESQGRTRSTRAKSRK